MRANTQCFAENGQNLTKGERKRVEEREVPRGAPLWLRTDVDVKRNNIRKIQLFREFAVSSVTDRCKKSPTSIYIMNKIVFCVLYKLTLTK